MKNSFKVAIKKVNVCDIYEVGNWASCYPWIRLGYKVEDYTSKYSDIMYCIKNKFGIFGYFLVYNIINVNKDDIIPLYNKKLVLYDFAIDSRAYAKYGLMLMNYLIKYAKNNGYKAIEIKKIDKYNFFFKFMNRHYKLKEFNGSYYIIIDNPKIKLSQKYLHIYEKDNVRINDLYFLYDMNFKVLKTIAKYKLNEKEAIVIDRLSGKINFPSHININKEVTLNLYSRSLIYFVYEMYKYNQIKDISVNYDNDIFEIIVGDTIYINKDSQVIMNDLKYALAMKDKGVKYIYSYIIEYNMNDRSYGKSFVKIECDKLIEKYTFSCDFIGEKAIEKINHKKKVNEFNEKLKNIKRFDFRFGNPFGGIKKLSIEFNEEVNISSNGQRDNDIEPNKEELIKELANFNFINWKEKYESNLNPINENAWTISLIFENEIIEYRGLDDYPRVWEYVEWFVNKYSRFYLSREE